MNYRGRHRSRSLRGPINIVLTVLALAALALPGAEGGYIARITNNGNSAATATYFTCTSAATGLNAALAWPLDDAFAGSNTQARDVSANSRRGTYSNTGVAFRQGVPACPRDLTDTLNSPNGTILDGLSGFIVDPARYPITNTFTEAIWFRTNTTRGGSLVGFGSTAQAMPAQYDRLIWMTNSGQLVFGVNPGIPTTITSPKSYNDNVFHQVVASLGTNGMRLYVDGVQVAFNMGTTTGQNYLLPTTGSMYLHVGVNNMLGWTPTPTSSYFGGTVRFASYFTSQLTADSVSSMYAAGQ